jgi:hypothetical protein
MYDILSKAAPSFQGPGVRIRLLLAHKGPLLVNFLSANKVDVLVEWRQQQLKEAYGRNVKKVCAIGFGMAYN